MSGSSFVVKVDQTNYVDSTSKISIWIHIIISQIENLILERVEYGTW